MPAGRILRSRARKSAANCRDMLRRDHEWQHVLRPLSRKWVLEGSVKHWRNYKFQETFESSFCRGSWAKCQRRRVASKQMHASCGTQSVQSAAIASRHCTELASGRTWLRLLQALWPSTPQSPAESWKTRGRGTVWGQKLANLFLNPVDH